MTAVLEWDYALFEFINRTCANGFLDSIMPYWREQEFWYPLYAMLIIFMVFNFPWKKAILFVVFLSLTVGVTDFVGSQGIKETVERARPCHEGTKVDARLLVECGSGYSFTSNHASDHMAIAIFLIVTLGFISRYFNYFVFLWALSIGIGQIYVGLHYPSDVLCGFILGTGIGYGGGYLFNKFVGLQAEENHDPLNSE